VKIVQGGLREVGIVGVVAHEGDEGGARREGRGPAEGAEALGGDAKHRWRRWRKWMDRLYPVGCC